METAGSPKTSVYITIWRHTQKTIILTLNRENDQVRQPTWNIVNLQINILVKSTYLWDTTPRSPLKVNGLFGGTCRLHLQDRRVRRARNQRGSRWQADLCWFLTRLILRPWKWRRYVSPKRPLTFNGLHGVISHIFITAAVRTSNPEYFSLRVSRNQTRTEHFPNRTVSRVSLHSLFSDKHCEYWRHIRGDGVWCPHLLEHTSSAPLQATRLF
jgi:hypothetical protein